MSQCPTRHDTQHKAPPNVKRVNSIQNIQNSSSNRNENNQVYNHDSKQWVSSMEQLSSWLDPMGQRLRCTFARCINLYCDHGIIFGNPTKTPHISTHCYLTQQRANTTKTEPFQLSSHPFRGQQNDLKITLTWWCRTIWRTIWATTGICWSHYWSE